VRENRRSNQEWAIQQQLATLSIQEDTENQKYEQQQNLGLSIFTSIIIPFPIEVCFLVYILLILM